MKRYLVLLPLICSLLTLKSQPIIQLENYASGFDEPVDIAHADDDRLFIVERNGTIRIIDTDGTVLPDDFLDIHTLIESGYSEQGLLGLAFHPDYETNGYFYVYYIDLDGNSVVARYSVNPFNENDAHEDSEYIIYTADQPFSNHNGGCIKFGPDGYLYIGFGDGGSAGDPGDRAQDPENALGKIHRLDIDSGDPYAIPADNPFYGSIDTLETIWDLGLRNPWRYSFDRSTGDLWIADVGQNLWEELNFETAGTGGVNYGWKCYEGNHNFSLGGCEDEDFYTFPIYEYNHSFSTGGYSITGGFVYRGDAFPGMNGYYIFADYVSGNWWYTVASDSGEFTTTFLDDIEDDISAFGEDVNGELYCADMSSGIIYHITDECGAFDISTTSTDYFCEESMGAINLETIEGVDPISIEWSTGSTDSELNNLLPGDYTVTVTDGTGCVREQTIYISDLEEEPAIPIFNELTSIISVSEGVAWQWYFNGNPIVGANESSLSIGDTGNYTVDITYDNGCVVSSETYYLPPLDLLQNLLMSQIKIYPNPADDIVNISSPEQIEIIALRLYSIEGNEIYQLQNISKSKNFSIDISSYPAGLYSLMLNTSVGTVNYMLQIIK
ncbi:MAG: PQQ-dependent sugar dehydrogenase [Chitinophagales bacterium]|nr:PQQ-dependent sugar dehydrogenase [Bacteroidota bacterium]MBP7398890.1 PQQ-dependent sugar dehydrogenase [Chitinophagales bacterium]MBP8754677.1 PQQ-dependent sugar dehydrogenase [Chitinophagales bacterium]MBP9189900.1 PQQ-dependent sugar dehydrogenase [Chitinophagales bacterium]MBP9549319.1 PQQ-dependent sugar dehydrogenase [Chitinophagales bacterium]